MRAARRTRKTLAASLLAVPLSLVTTVAVPLFSATPAHACGCFSPTTVASPVVQAGEKILFAKQNGMIVMHVQVQYSGPASSFGWLLPLPAIPVNAMGVSGAIDVGVQEVFDKLGDATQPTYSLTTYPCGGTSSTSGFGCGGASAAGTFNDAPEQGPDGHSTSPLVKQDSVGPYNYAILDASNKTAMLNWLSTNGYAPTVTDAALAPYIHPGGYFLALQLKSGQSTGDLQPVVLHFPSDLPMVPINLTSASATPNMGILIWVLGSARAIPRNYYNTVVNDAQLDWLNQVKNYADVVAKAVREVDGHHGFVTEFAGKSNVMQGALGSSSRFAFIDQQGLAMLKDPITFVEQLLQPDFTSGRGGTRFTLDGQLTAILGTYIPMPALVAVDTTPGEYYGNLRFYLGTDRTNNPQKYMDIEATLAKFDPAKLVQDLKDRIVTPTLAAQALFSDPSLPALTRLYTVMSPDDMNLDPVFSYNPDLPEVPKNHSGQLQLKCPKDGYPNTRLTTDSGWKVELPDAPNGGGGAYPTLASVPYAQRIEQVMDTGMPTVKVDNSDAIQKSLAAAGPGAHGCTALSDGRRHPTPGLLGLLGLGIGMALLRRRPQRTRA